MPMNEAVDAVVTWVDGADPAHRRKLDDYLASLGRPRDGALHEAETRIGIQPFTRQRHQRVLARARRPHHRQQHRRTPPRRIDVSRLPRDEFHRKIEEPPTCPS